MTIKDENIVDSLTVCIIEADGKAFMSHLRDGKTARLIPVTSREDATRLLNIFEGVLERTTRRQKGKR